MLLIASLFVALFQPPTSELPPRHSFSFLNGFERIKASPITVDPFNNFHYSQAYYHRQCDWKPIEKLIDETLGQRDWQKERYKADDRFEAMTIWRGKLHGPFWDWTIVCSHDAFQPHMTESAADIVFGPLLKKGWTSLTVSRFEPLNAKQSRRYRMLTSYLAKRRK